MQTTNVNNLPESLCRALSVDRYDYENTGDISVTAAIMPPRMRQLLKRHSNEITEDVSERIWKVIGDIGHSLIERAAPENAFTEERLSATRLGWKITGKVDLLREHGNDYAIEDFKFTSTWAIKDPKPEWEAQLNFYRWLAAQNGFHVTALRIVAILRDWSKPRALREEGYPQVGVVIREVPLWSTKQCEETIMALIARHQDAEKLSDDDLPLCTAEERWERPTIYAVKKKGNKRAERGGLFETEHEAAAMIGSFGSSAFEVEKRPGMSVRCVQYCAVRSFCSFGRALNDAGVIDG